MRKIFVASHALLLPSFRKPELTPKPILETESIALCYLRSDAASVVCAYLKENEAYFKNSRGLYPPNYFTPEQQQLILEMESRRRSTGKGFRFYIISKEHKAIIGDIHFNEIVRGAFQSCFVGYKVAEEYSGKGIMSEALQLASHLKINGQWEDHVRFALLNETI